MALKKKNGLWYGSTIDDLRAEVLRYSHLTGYDASIFAQSICRCGGTVFKLASDETEGAAKRTCTNCRQSVYMGDSGDYLADAVLEEHICMCDNDSFELLSGVAVYGDTTDVRWYYLGCRCPKCSLVGVFADWKCDAGDATAFLARI